MLKVEIRLVGSDMQSCEQRIMMFFCPYNKKGWIEPGKFDDRKKDCVEKESWLAGEHQYAG